MTTTRFLAFTLLLIPCVSNSGEPLELTKATIDTGGGESSGGTLVLRATIGQFDAGELRGGEMSLDEGFWTPTRIDFLLSDGFEED